MSDLGSSGISRRDFLNGVMIASGGLAVSQSVPMRLFGAPPPKTDTCDGVLGSEPRALRGGNLPSAFLIAHWMRDRRLHFTQDSVTLTAGCDPQKGVFPIHNEKPFYDVIIVGSGLSGLSTALYIQNRRPGSKILILDANQQVGGNSGRDDGAPLPVAAATAGSYCVAPYADFQREVYKSVGVEWEKYKINAPLYSYYFDDRTPGIKKGYKGWNIDSYGAGLKSLPYSPEIVQQLERCRAEFIKWGALPGAPTDPADVSDPKWDSLGAISLHDYLTQNLKCDPLVSDFFTRYSIDALGGTTEHVNAHSGISFLSTEYGDLFAFPGGNSGLARHLVHKLVKNVFDGNSSEQILANPILEKHLDDPHQSVQIRQHAVALRVDQTASETSVVYHKDGEFRRAHGKTLVLAGQGHTAKHLVEHMIDEDRKKAWGQFTMIPVVVANVAIRSAAPFLDLGFGYNQYWWGSKYWADWVAADWTSAGKTNKDRPTVLTFFGGNTAAPEQMPAERFKLLNDSFGDYEKSLKEDLSRVMAGTHFDFDRDVTGICVYRWGHGMIMPTLNFPFGNGLHSSTTRRSQGARHIACAQLGRISFAGQDSEGTPSVESALSSGLRAAKEVLAVL